MLLEQGAHSPKPGTSSWRQAQGGWGCHVAAQPQEVLLLGASVRGVSTEGGIWMGQLAKWQPSAGVARRWGRRACKAPCLPGRCGQTLGLITGTAKAQDGASDFWRSTCLQEQCGASPGGSPTEGAKGWVQVGWWRARSSGFWRQHTHGDRRGQLSGVAEGRNTMPR